MILPDVNILLYAYDKGSEFHESAREWLETALTTEQVVFSWHTLTGFLRIITHPSAMVNPTSIEKAISIVDKWLQLDNTHLINLEKKNWPIFSSILIDAQATGNLVMDAHLAALAISCGASIATRDRDFRRFQGLRQSDPVSKVPA